MIGSGLRLTWLGHSTVVVEVAGARIVADPLLRPRIGLLRRTGALPEPAVGLLQAGVDAVLVSHLHHDHCDLPTLRALAAPVVVAPPGAGDWLARQGVRGVVERAPGESVQVRGARVVATPAVHAGRRVPWGPVAQSVGHLVEGTPDDAAPAAGRAGRRTPPVAWLAGDTGLFDGMARLAQDCGVTQIDVAAVPVWGWGPSLGPEHLDPERAAEAVVLARVRRAVPVHWGTLHPAFLSRAMREQLRTPGHRFAAALDRLAGEHGVPVGAAVLPVGASLEVPPRPA